MRKPTGINAGHSWDMSFGLGTGPAARPVWVMRQMMLPCARFSAVATFTSVIVVAILNSLSYVFIPSRVKIAIYICFQYLPVQLFPGTALFSMSDVDQENHVSPVDILPLTSLHFSCVCLLSTFFSSSQAPKMMNEHQMSKQDGVKAEHQRFFVWRSRRV